MSATHYSLRWDSHQNNICNGFAKLQLDEEFVDLTLAAEGYLVKVHKNLVALSSPYIKEMLKSVPCQYPVIFLNNVSHETLCYILEYIYTGEVKVPFDKLQSFLVAATDLRIRGINNFMSTKINEPPVHPSSESLQSQYTGFNDIPNITINERTFHVEVQQNSNLEQTDPILNKQLIDNENMININIASSDNNITTTHSMGITQNDLEIISTNFNGIQPQYTVSNRGALQLILNRYMYYSHHQSCGGRKRRWRCLEYRNKQCPAFIDTDDDIITLREGVHSHPFHDKKIIRKIAENKLYTSTKMALEEMKKKCENM